MWHIISTINVSASILIYSSDEFGHKQTTHTPRNVITTAAHSFNRFRYNLSLYETKGVFERVSKRVDPDNRRSEFNYIQINTEYSIFTLLYFKSVLLATNLSSTFVVLLTRGFATSNVRSKLTAPWYKRAKGWTSHTRMWLKHLAGWKARDTYNRVCSHRLFYIYIYYNRWMCSTLYRRQMQCNLKLTCWLSSYWIRISVTSNVGKYLKTIVRNGTNYTRN